MNGAAGLAPLGAVWPTDGSDNFVGGLAHDGGPEFLPSDDADRAALAHRRLVRRALLGHDGFRIPGITDRVGPNEEQRGDRPATDDEYQENPADEQDQQRGRGARPYAWPRVVVVVAAVVIFEAAGHGG